MHDMLAIIMVVHTAGETTFYVRRPSLINAHDLEVHVYGVDATLVTVLGIANGRPLAGAKRKTSYGITFVVQQRLDW